MVDLLDGWEEGTMADPLSPSVRTQVHPEAFVSPHALRRGDYTIQVGPGCVVHPRATILAVGGPVELGMVAASVRACMSAHAKCRPIAEAI